MPVQLNNILLWRSIPFPLQIKRKNIEDPYPVGVSIMIMIAFLLPKKKIIGALIVGGHSNPPWELSQVLW